MSRENRLDAQLKNVPKREKLSPEVLKIIGEDPDKDTGRYIPALLLTDFTSKEIEELKEAIGGEGVDFTIETEDLGQVIKFTPGFTVQKFCEMIQRLYPLCIRRFLANLLITGYRFSDHAGLECIKRGAILAIEFTLIPPAVSVSTELLRVPIKYYIDLNGFINEPEEDDEEYPEEDDDEEEESDFVYTTFEINMKIGDHDFLEYTNEIDYLESSSHLVDRFGKHDYDKKALIFLGYREMWRFGFIGSKEFPGYKGLGSRYLRSEKYL
jgi:hypothetical protein